MTDTRKSYPEMEIEEALNHVRNTVDIDTVDDKNTEIAQAYYAVLRSPNDVLMDVVSNIRAMIDMFKGI